MVQGYVDELNDGLNRWETIKQFTILDRDLTVDEGELTPEPEAAPQDRRGALRVGDRPAVPLRCEPAYPVPTFGPPSAGLRWLRVATRYACCTLSP